MLNAFSIYQQKSILGWIMLSLNTHLDVCAC